MVASFSPFDAVTWKLFWGVFFSVWYKRDRIPRGPDLRDPLHSPKGSAVLGLLSPEAGPRVGVQLVPSSLSSTPSKGLMVSRGAKCVPRDLTLTEWTGLSVTEGVSEWFGRQYPFPSISRHLGHDSIQLCTDTARPRSAPGGPGLTSETSSRQGWSMPSDNKWNSHLFPHPPPLGTSHPLARLTSWKMIKINCFI